MGAHGIDAGTGIPAGFKVQVQEYRGRFQSLWDLLPVSLTNLWPAILTFGWQIKLVALLLKFYKF